MWLKKMIWFDSDIPEKERLQQNRIGNRLCRVPQQLLNHRRYSKWRASDEGPSSPGSSSWSHPDCFYLIFFGGFYARWVGRKDRQGNKRNLKDEKVNKIKIEMCSSLVCSQFYGSLNLYVLKTKTDFRNICKDKPRGVFQIVAKQSFQQNKIICSNRTAP